jgi:CBS domain containing-hemolysin-like protein
MIGGLIASVALLLANAFFVAVEFSLITARQTKLEPLAEQGGKRARLALSASHELSLELAGAQLGVTMASLGLGFVTEPLISGLIERTLDLGHHLPSGLVHTLGFLIGLALVSVAHMVIGEMVPKNVAIADPERTLLWLALPNRAYMVVFRPIVRALNGMANLGVRAFGVEPRDELEAVHSAAELGQLVGASRDEGLLDEFEHELLSGALGFGRRPVRDVMVPWAEVTTVGRDAIVADLEAVLVRTGYTRVPVLAADGSTVMGFFHAKDLLTLPADARERPLPLGRLRRMLIVDPGGTLEDVLLTMQRARVHLAVVRGTEGEPVGMVSLEDLLEQLVGDIRDESDLPVRRDRA